MPQTIGNSITNKVVKTLFSILLFVIIPALLPSLVYANDTTPPATTHTMTPPAPDGKNDWYKSIVTFDLQATDLESGVKDMFYRIDGGVWQKLSFNPALNLAPNGSFNNGMAEWERTPDGASIHPDNSQYEPNFPPSSLYISSTETGWHAINNRVVFAVANPYANMSAGVSFKTENIVGEAYFDVYVLAQNPATGTRTSTKVAQSNTITGTNDWTRLYANFVANDPNAIGIYLDIGFNGTGTAWLDAVNISNSTTQANTTFTVGTDSSNHVVEYYSTDFAGNSEAIHTVTFKQDQTPPGNWQDSGAFRGVLGPSNHHLYVFTNVQDATSGISTLTDKFQYHTEEEQGFGIHSNLMKCSSSWLPNEWAILISPPFLPGVHSAYLLTPKIDFCNSNWKTCKTVRFQTEDMAGNVSHKDFCINGPWIKLRGGGGVRSNNIIDMLSEANGYNSDGVIEVKGSVINFFSTSRDWYAYNTPSPEDFNYEKFLDLAGNVTTITNNILPTTSGKYLINSDFTVKGNTLPGSYDSATFNQVVFINGNLTIESDIETTANSAALFVVNGDVKVGKKVENIEVAIVADGTFSTAYNISEGESSKTLVLKGIYSADKFEFQRTLQGTNNSDIPSEDFTFEPKYFVQIKEFFGGEFSVKWKSID